MATVTINGASYLYVAISNTGNKIVSYSINNNTGALTEIGTRVTSIRTLRPLVIQNIDGNYYMYVIIFRFINSVRISDINTFSISSSGILSAIGTPIYCGVTAQSFSIVSI
jgi:6-phosphogluconolactonase (cycloisomerase 2 family)